MKRRVASDVGKVRKLSDNVKFLTKIRNEYTRLSHQAIHQSATKPPMEFRRFPGDSTEISTSHQRVQVQMAKCIEGMRCIKRVSQNKFIYHRKVMVNVSKGSFKTAVSSGKSSRSQFELISQLMMCQLATNEKQILKFLICNQHVMCGGRHVFIETDVRSHLVKRLLQLNIAQSMRRRLLQLLQQCPSVSQVSAAVSTLSCLSYSYQSNLSDNTLLDIDSDSSGRLPNIEGDTLVRHIFINFGPQTVQSPCDETFHEIRFDWVLELADSQLVDDPDCICVVSLEQTIHTNQLSRSLGMLQHADSHRLVSQRIEFSFNSALNYNSLEYYSDELIGLFGVIHFTYQSHNYNYLVHLENSLKMESQV